MSKWYLATGGSFFRDRALGLGRTGVLLVSALLTAGYLLPLTIQGFFPGHDFKSEEIEKRKLAGKEPSLWMLVPIGILAAGTLLFGCFPDYLLSVVQSTAAAVL